MKYAAGIGILVLLIIWGIFLINGKGGFLLSDYGTMSEREKEMYNEKVLLRIGGYAMIIFSSLVILGIVGEELGIWQSKYFAIAAIIILLGGILYANISSLFGKDD